ncbi:MAG: hypothetical protein NZT61_04200, partial [Deltaproteobacteria bacterium]|nr:hypothetical protein [Deltaproteobacteria bacterium]
MCSALVDEKLGENQTNQDRQVSKAGNPTVRDLAEAILSNQAKLDRYAVAIGLYSPSGNEIGALKLNIEELGVLYKASEGKSLSNDDKALFNSAVQKTVELVEKIGRNYLGNQSTETKDGAKLDLNEARDLYSKEVKKTIDNILSKIPPDLDPVTKQRLIGLAVASEAKPQYIFRNETVTPTVQVSGQEVMLKSVFFTEGQKTFYDNYKDTATTVTIKIVSLQGTILRLSQLYKAWQEANISGNNEQKARVIESLRSEATLSITDEQLKNANTNPKIIEDNINQRLLELKAELDSEMDKAVKLDKYAKQVL